MSASLEDRVVELEHRLTFAERTVEELSAVVAEQARTIAALDTKVDQLTRRLQDVAAWEPSPQDDQPPPHY
jgi:SlyX protein